MSVKRAPRYRHVSEIHKETLEYIIHRKAGLIRSLRTPWNKLNRCILDGLEWGGIYIVGGRPGTGKTSVVSQITDSAKANNPDQDFAVLNFQLEMTDRVIGVRQLTKPMGLRMDQLFSADPLRLMTDTDIINISDYHRQHINDQIYYVTDPLTAVEFAEEVLAFHAQVKKPIVVTLDHSILIRKSASEQSHMDMLYTLSEVLVRLKKAIPDSMYIVLSQMNRSIEDADRRINGKIANFPTASDLFGADALMQNADVVMLLNRPDLMGITQYGPDKIAVTNGMMVFHLIKNRFGEQSMLFFNQNLQHFEINEAPTPNEILAKMNAMGMRPQSLPPQLNSRNINGHP